MKNEEQIDLLNAAKGIHALVKKRGVNTIPPEVPRSAFDAFQNARRETVDYIQAGPSYAGRVQQRRARMLNAFEAIQTALTRWKDLLDANESVEELPFHDVYNDLLALRNEFEAVEVDMGLKELRVTTDNIIMTWEDEDFEFGPFDICLNWGYGELKYRCIAKEPHPAMRHHSVTHPHVNQGLLCEGEGTIPIRNALLQGRILDAMDVINGVLHTYAEGQAHVELSRWHSQPCKDCGGGVAAEDAYTCNRCGATLCEECMNQCTECEEYFCDEHSYICDGCGGIICRNHRMQCVDCGEYFCSQCLNSDDRCSTCQEVLDNEQEEEADGGEGLEPFRGGREPADNQIPIPLEADEPADSGIRGFTDQQGVVSGP